VDIFSLVTHACPLRNFLKFNLPLGIFGQPAKNQFFNRPSVYPLESPAACSGDENYSLFSEHGL
jgi:hypothetical protein